MVIDIALEQQIRAVQQCLPHSEERQHALLQLVDTLLRSRQVGRAPRGYPLTGVYEVITDRLRQCLLTELGAALECPPSLSLAAWVTERLAIAYRQGLDDEVLKHLALEAQRHPAQSPLRRHALTQLVEAIRRSGRLARPHRAKFAPEMYDVLYDEAVNRTLTYVCRQIDTYDPQRGEAQKFMNWVNFRLDRTVIDCRRELGDPQVYHYSTLSDLEAMGQPEEPESLGDAVRECLQRNADQTFTRAHIRDRPDVTFQAIALARLAGQSWEEISQEVNVKIPTLSSFFQRCCQKFAPIFRANT